MESSLAVNILKYGYSVLQIETMSNCNMKCRFCAYPTRLDKGKILSEEIIYNIIDSLTLDDKFEYICFSHFNEPLLDNRIYKFIEKAKSKKLPVMVITNGLLFKNKDVILNLIKASPTYIKISLQTLNERIFHYARNIDSSFLEYRNGIFEFLSAAYSKQSKITVDIACNFFSFRRKINSILFGLERGDPSVYNTVDNLRSDMKTFLKELYVFDNRFVLPDERKIDKFLNNLGLDYLRQAGLNISDNISIKIKPFIYGNKLVEFFPIKGGIACSNRILGILANGNVVPCCLAYGDILTLGNLKNDNLKDILEKNINWFNSIRKGRDLPLACRRCLGAPTRRGAFLKYIYHKCFK